ncbi:hypothetical protein [Nocardia sp. NPDC047038]|uniref:hypothetical protein n=1 Tax=Nocardia sp. NPDC047038 TaxID=3154338 RepID=UPI0033E5FBD1
MPIEIEMAASPVFEVALRRCQLRAALPFGERVVELARLAKRTLFCLRQLACEGVVAVVCGGQLGGARGGVVGAVKGGVPVVLCEGHGGLGAVGGLVGGKQVLPSTVMTTSHTVAPKPAVTTLRSFIFDDYVK